MLPSGGIGNSSTSTSTTESAEQQVSLVLLGPAVVRVPQGTPYQDAGALAVDGTGAALPVAVLSGLPLSTASVTPLDAPVLVVYEARPQAAGAAAAVRATRRVLVVPGSAGSTDPPVVTPVLGRGDRVAALAGSGAALQGVITQVLVGQPYVDQGEPFLPTKPRRSGREVRVASWDAEAASSVVEVFA